MGFNPVVTINTLAENIVKTFQKLRSTRFISTCEELSYPHYANSEFAKELDTLAKKHNATVLGTQINPGFLMDTLVITITAVCQKIEKIEAVRANRTKKGFCQVSVGFDSAVVTC